MLRPPCLANGVLHPPHSGTLRKLFCSIPFICLARNCFPRMPVATMGAKAADTGGSNGARGPWSTQRPDKNEKNDPICSIFHYLQKHFPEGMPPEPPNSLIYSVFLGLAAAGPLQCERLEPPVFHHSI